MTDSNKSISLLRQRMIDDMTLRKLAPKTQAGYLRAVIKFSLFFGRSPDLASPEDLRLSAAAVLRSVVTCFAVKTVRRSRSPITPAVTGTVQGARAVQPGGGLLDGQRWVACKPGFFLPVRVLSRLFRRLLLEKLSAAHHAGQLQFFGQHQNLVNAKDFANYLSPLRKIDWVVYAKRPFAGPEAVLAYLSRYTHRVAIANSRLIACDEQGVTFKWKDYRAKQCDRHKTMTLATDEFIRRFLIHVLPSGFHRIRHYGLFANHTRVKQVQRLHELFSDDSIAPAIDAVENNLPTATCTCLDCGAAMFIIETFEKHMPRAPPACS